jgi:tetratricopeptide (TPR) repeat protein
MNRAAQVTLIMASLAIAAIGVALSIDRKSPPVVSPPPLIDPEVELDPMIRDLVEARRTSAIERSDDPAARRAMADALCANGMLEQAIEAYRQTLQLDPADTRAWYGLARAHERLGEVEESLFALDRAIAIDRERPFLHGRRGWRLLDLGRLDEARVAFRAAIELAPDVAARVGLARIDLLQGKNADAERLVADILAENPDHPNAALIRQVLGMAQRNLGKLDKAATQLSQATGRLDDWRDPWSDEIDESQTGYNASIQRAQSMLERGENASAAQLLLQVLRYKPDHVAALNFLSMTSFREGDATRGFELLHRALEADPDHYATHLNLSRAYQAINDAPRAIEHANRSLELNPSSEEAHQQLIQLLLAQGRETEAAAVLEAALSSGVGGIGARVLLGRIQLRLEQWREAQESFQMVLQSAPDHAGAHRGAALALAEQGDFDRAMQHLQRAQQLSPDDPQLPSIAQRVSALQQSASQTHK